MAREALVALSTAFIFFNLSEGLPAMQWSSACPFNFAILKFGVLYYWIIFIHCEVWIVAIYIS